MTDQFTYVSVLLSIVVALALTHLLSGIAALVRVGLSQSSLVYFAWVGVFFFSCVDYWFSIWGLRGSEAWSLAYVLFLLILATLLYLCCHLVMPDVRNGAPIDLVAFHERSRRKYLGAFFLYVVLGAAANLTISGFATAVAINMASLVLIGSAWRWSDTRVQFIAVAVSTALYVYYAVRYIPSL